MKPLYITSEYRWQHNKIFMTNLTCTRHIVVVIYLFIFWVLVWFTWSKWFGLHRLPNYEPPYMAQDDDLGIQAKMFRQCTTISQPVLMLQLKNCQLNLRQKMTHLWIKFISYEPHRIFVISLSRVIFMQATNYFSPKKHIWKEISNTYQSSNPE